jgi:hypothetical protein
MTSGMTNTSKGEGSQHQTKRHIKRDSLLVQRMPEPKFYPFSTTSREVFGELRPDFRLSGGRIKIGDGTERILL